MFDEAARSDLEQAAGKPGTARAGMARLTTIGCGGGAAFLLEADSPEQLAAILEVAARFSLDRFVLGLGSNLLVADSGWDGLVIKLSGKLKDCHASVPGEVKNRQESKKRQESKNRQEAGGGQIECGGGASLPRAATTAVDAGLSGLEPLAGIPGTIGGAVAMNAGAWGTSIAELIRRVEISLPGEVRTLEREQLNFSYRQAELPEGSVVSRVVLDLNTGDPEEIRAAAADFRRRRAETQPTGERSCGSVFRNPETGSSAGELLDRAGCKGLKHGAAAVSQTHANFIINEGGCSAADVIRLMDECRRRVHEKFGVILEPEVKFLGNISLKPLT